jgi:hypothetical protein
MIQDFFPKKILLQIEYIEAAMRRVERIEILLK